MDINYFTSLFYAGIPLWVLTGGGLLCLLIDSLALKNGRKILYPVASLTFVVALWFAFKQWLGGIDYAQDLLLMDRVSLFFVIIVIFVGLLTLFNTYSYLKAGDGKGCEGIALSPGVVTLILLAVVGMIFLFASDHLIVNFIGLETMSLAVYVLVGSNRRDIRSNEAAIKYYILGSVASALLLYGIALLYGSFGTFQLSALADVIIAPSQVHFPTIAAVLLLTGLLFKIALVPFHFWVPDVYEGAPSPVTGFMATGVKLAVFALFIRVLNTLNFFPFDTSVTILSILIILTLTVGNLGAIVQDNVKRMLAYSSIAHAGYLLLGLLAGFKNGKFDAEVTSAVLFYLVAYSFMTLGAFAVLSVMVHKKKEACQFSDLTGLGFKRPFLAAAFSLFMISLLGIPPTAGFVAKFSIFSYAVKSGYIGLAVLGVIMVVVSAYYYLRPLVMMYFRESDKGLDKEVTDKYPIGYVPFPLMFSLVFCAAVVLYLGVRPIDYIHMAQIAANVFK